MSTTPIRIMLVDDHEVVRRGLTELLESSGHIDVVADAGTIAEAVAAARRSEPEVAVLDVRLPDGNGIDLCRTLREQNPGLTCLMLTSFADDTALIAAAEAGASAYLLKEVTSTDIVEAVKKVAAGAQLLDEATVRLAKRRLSQSEEGQLETLSPQELRIFNLIGAGLSNRQIGEELFLAEKTVKNYVSRMLAKLGMDRRTEAAALAALVEERKRERFT